jgi:hypothetical protein
MAGYPNFPVTYSSVRESSGLEKIFSVGACSTISPESMKAVVSATRAACCMLWVTMTIVHRCFACSGPITGYQIQPQIPAQSLDTEVFATDRTTKAVVPTDFFSCSGIIPSYGINCVGTYGGSYEVVAGQFSIDPKLCDEPRVDPLLSVVYATKSSTGAVTQAIAGPFDLGRPRGCPKSSQNGKWRIPQEKEESPL